MLLMVWSCLQDLCMFLISSIRLSPCRPRSSKGRGLDTPLTTHSVYPASYKLWNNYQDLYLEKKIPKEKNFSQKPSAKHHDSVFGTSLLATFRLRLEDDGPLLGVSLAGVMALTVCLACAELQSIEKNSSNTFTSSEVQKTSQQKPLL